MNTCWKSRQNPTDGAKKPQGRLSPPTICLVAKNWTNQNRREALFVEGAGDGFKTALALLVENGDPSMYYFVHFGNCSFYKSAKKILFRKSTNQNFTRMTKNQSVKWQFRYLTKLFNHRFYACRIFFYSICISFLVYGEGRGKKSFHVKLWVSYGILETHFFFVKGHVFFF